MTTPTSITCSCRSSSTGRWSATARTAATSWPASARTRSSAASSPADDGETTVRIRMVNTGGIAIATVQTPGGEVTYDGDARIDGVPGTAAPVMLDFADVAGSSCGALLPTGNAHDDIDGVAATLIDNGMPVVVLNAADFGKRGDETPAELEADDTLKAQIEKIPPRRRAADEPRRRARQDGAEDESGLAGARRRRDRNPHVYSASRARRDRRARRSERRRCVLHTRQRRVRGRGRLSRVASWISNTRPVASPSTSTSRTLVASIEYGDRRCCARRAN